MYCLDIELDRKCLTLANTWKFLNEIWQGACISWFPLKDATCVVMNECPLEIRVNLEPGIRAVQMQNLNSFALKLDKILNRKWVFIDVLGGVL